MSPKHEAMTRRNYFIPPEMVERLKEQMRKTGITESEFVRRAIEVALDADAQKDRIRRIRSGHA